jgi:hypothetical protein
MMVGVPKPVGKPKFVPQDDRNTPETPGRNPKPVGNPAISKAKNKYRNLALKNKLNKTPTAHQQHLAHKQHVANVKNNPKKYG